ncbi:MAG: 5-methylcytosine-specific restriction endonuclease system specificity protein McrC [Flavobacteriales bacterium]|nr:5-methylcytosine-specific restriction endonuclease system specificity protein McrC [Flavobacteriales bacterium]
MEIPIQNLYYLLSYAWDKLEERERVRVEVTERTDLVDLFAKVLIQSTRLLLKRGIDRSYVTETEEIAGVKGKLDLTASVKRQLLDRQRTMCSFDELSPDILTNRILVTTLDRLMRVVELDHSHRNDVRKLRLMFPEIRPLELHARHFDEVRIHRNNRFYDFVLKVCRMIYDCLLPTEDPGIFHFLDFQRDEEKMNRLFEAFVRNFYKHELRGFEVSRESIEWQFNSEVPSHLEFLPGMHTDITLTAADRKLILDTKYYRQTLAVDWGNRVHSGNLYQIFSYLMNQENASDNRTLTATGILLYPTVTKEVNLSYTYAQHPIRVHTVNLDEDWRAIEQRLVSIIHEGTA